MLIHVGKRGPDVATIIVRKTSTWTSGSDSKIYHPRIRCTCPWNSLSHYTCRSDSRFAPSQWETSFLCNADFHWLSTNPESAMICVCVVSPIGGAGRLCGDRIKLSMCVCITYHETSNIRRTFGQLNCWSLGCSVHRLSVLLQLHLHSRLYAWLQWIGQRQLQDETRNIYVLWFGVPYISGLTVYIGCFYLCTMVKTRKLNVQYIFV